TLRRAVPHPFAISPPLAGSPSTAELYLPSAGSSPLRSPELAANRAAKDRGTVRVLPWTVPIILPPVDADLEATIDHPHGSSVGWVADVRRLAEHLVGRGR